ncbi:MAG: hypothetical protein V1820_01730 [archaeon]
MQADFESVVRKLVEDSQLPREEILSLIEGKKKELPGLISDLGAAHIIANELGIQTLPSLKTIQKIEDLKPGTPSVELIARVLRVYEKREFDKGGRKGQVASLLILDETGTTRLVLWGVLANLAETVTQGDILKVSNAYVKQDLQGRSELHASNRTRVALNPEGEGKDLPSASSGLASAGTFSAKEKYISELSENETAQVTFRATVMKVFDTRSPFYETCPTCSKSINTCAEHDHATTKRALILNILVDDGTGVIRATLFKQAAEALLGMKTEEAEKLADLAGNPLVIYAATNKLIGTERVFTGRARYNSVFERMELVANSVLNVDVAREVEKLTKELEATAK